MTLLVNGLKIRKTLGRADWRPPIPWGGDTGWLIQRTDGTARVLVSEFPWLDGVPWIHASIARPDTMPTYDDLTLMHRAVFGEGFAYQVFAPPAEHINIHEHALHLWGRADGQPVLPDFGMFGSI